MTLFNFIQCKQEKLYGVVGSFGFLSMWLTLLCQAYTAYDEFTCLAYGFGAYCYLLKLDHIVGLKKINFIVKK